MSPAPARRKIYHITHVDNLATIVASGGLISDAQMIARGGPPASIGLSNIKKRRLSLPVTCHPGDFVGQYVPFYFCPRSIMLYLICRANHPELTYRGGQEPIVHLEADLHAVVAWTKQAGRRWAFSLSNAGAAYASFRSSLTQLSDVNWVAVAASDFREPAIKEGKQAEFLVHGSFPWSLVERIGVHSPAIRDRAAAAIATAPHKPRLDVRREWYY
jgi:hypothetical protein